MKALLTKIGHPKNYFSPFRRIEMTRGIIASYFIFMNMEISVSLIEMTDPEGECSYFKMHEAYSVSNPSWELKKNVVDIIQTVFLHYLSFCQ